MIHKIYMKNDKNNDIYIAHIKNDIHKNNIWNEIHGNKIEWNKILRGIAER